LIGERWIEVENTSEPVMVNITVIYGRLQITANRKTAVNFAEALPMPPGLYQQVLKEIPSSIAGQYKHYWIYLSPEYRP
jgi:hypothetical protein